MKRVSIIVVALAFLVALTQCKKEQVTPANDSEGVAITLDIKSNGNTRMDVNTGTGAVTYQSGDVIYVASGGKYVGTLTHDGTHFAGTITDPVVGEPLHFYFLGNVTPSGTLTAGTTQSCSVIISVQTEHLPVIEYAPSEENYTGGATAFTAMLLNKCALVKFNVTTSSLMATCITGFNNKVTVDFSSNTLTPSKVGTGIIQLAAGSGEKWAILLPQDAMEAGSVGSAYSAEGLFVGTCGAVPAITENGYLTSGIDVVVTTMMTSGEVPTGAIRGKFTINDNGDQVYFSKGNLQYIGSANTWKFAENQKDYLGNNGQGLGEDQYLNRDIFCWGTSGYNHGATHYHPWNRLGEYDCYHAYNDPYANLYDYTGKADWGYNAISNGGNTENSGWRTLTLPEWDYVFNTRYTISGIRYAKAKVDGTNGVILLPDNWNDSFYSLNSPNTRGADYNTNVISSNVWGNLLEPKGVVLLPAAGFWFNVDPDPDPYGIEDVYAMNEGGFYWSSSSYGYSNARIVEFYDDSFNLNYSRLKDYGYSVRLVRNVN